MKPFEISRNTTAIRFGYRSPQLTRVMDAEGKMLLSRELGMSVIEPIIMPNEFPDLDKVKTYRAAADKHGITVGSAGAFTQFDTLLDRDEFDAFCEFTFTACKILGVDYLFTMAPRIKENRPHRESWQRTAESIRCFAGRAQDQGIRIGLEPEYFLGSLERVVRMIETVDHPNFQHINFDATNLFLNGSDPLEAIAKHGERIISGHIKDGFYQAEKHGETRIGDGELNWHEIISALLDAGCSCNLYLEHCKTPEDVKDAAAVIRAVIEELQPD